MPHAPLTAVLRRLPENWVSTVAILTRPAHGVVFNAMDERKTDCEFCRADYIGSSQEFNFCAGVVIWCAFLSSKSR